MESVKTLSILAGTRAHAIPASGFLIRRADGAADIAAYRRLRHDEFVVEQAMFATSDADDVDDDPRTVVLLAVAAGGAVLGGVRLAPQCEPDIGWWAGSRLVTAAGARSAGVGPALVRAACAHAEGAGVLRFDAAVQRRYASMFDSLGWEDHGDCVVAGHAHAAMRWPLHRMQRLADSTKSFLGDALAPLRAVPGGLGPAGFVGDDGVPVPGSDLVAACDAIIPSMVERDPEWAGWCSVLVNVNDLTAMGAAPTGLLDAVGAPTRSLLTRIVRGIARGSQAWRVPVLGGHTQVGVPASLAVTAFGRTSNPIRAGGGSPGDALRLTADLNGDWRARSPWQTMGFEQHPSRRRAGRALDPGGSHGAAGGQGRQHGGRRRYRRHAGGGQWNRCGTRRRPHTAARRGGHGGLADVLPWLRHADRGPAGRSGSC